MEATSHSMIVRDNTALDTSLETDIKSRLSERLKNFKVVVSLTLPPETSPIYG